MSHKKHDLYFDTIIVGAGVSGINAAYRVQSESLASNYVIFESRDSLGGTWDFFRYPGLRSDSDMFTFGLTWSPWDHKKLLGSGAEIKDYLVRSVKSAGIDQKIRYQHSVESARWISEAQCWELGVRVRGKDLVVYRSQFVLLATGYYDYETPMQTVIPGIDKFGGKVIHPQFWPEDYNYAGKDIVVVGSGATAVTLIPALAEKAKHVTMLQRSPSYIMPLAQSSLLASLVYAILPVDVARQVNRFLWLFWNYFSTSLCKAYPEFVKASVRRKTIEQLPDSISVDPHFTPRYNPWEQRFCACKDGDFFSALRSGKADVVTDTVETVTEDGIQLASGKCLKPNVIVTATGLKLKFGGGVKFTVDGQPVDFAQKFAWKQTMLQDVPNMFFLTGYEKASWTLGADVSTRLFIRLVNAMKKKRASVVVPRQDNDMPEVPILNLSSTYMQNAGAVFPKGGTGQWKPRSHYFADMVDVKWGDVTSGLVFS